MPRQYDVGVLIDVITNVDVTGCSGTWFKVQMPDFTERTWSAGVVSSGDGRIRHVVESGDLPQVGEYIVNPRVLFNDVKDFHTSAFRFRVDPLFLP
jgi:hypothetical protein